MNASNAHPLATHAEVATQTMIVQVVKEIIICKLQIQLIILANALQKQMAQVLLS